jgi:hypothetical protein
MTSNASPGGCGKSRSKHAGQGRAASSPDDQDVWSDGICFPTYDIVLKKRGRSLWSWQIIGDSGQLIMRGYEASRPAARYQSTRALFLLLSAPRAAIRAAGR